MAEEIVKHSEMKPASFVGVKNDLTNGQKNLLELMKKRISEGAAITKEDIIDCYIISCSKDGINIRIRHNLHSVDSYFNRARPVRVVYYTKDTSGIWAMAKTWFQHNLGACIIKSHLLVIPIIQID